MNFIRPETKDKQALRVIFFYVSYPSNMEQKKNSFHSF